MTRQHSTDEPFTGTYFRTHDPGLFRHLLKYCPAVRPRQYDSQPAGSLTAPLVLAAQRNRCKALPSGEDALYQGIEVLCARAGDAHLGTLNDGPKPLHRDTVPSGLRCALYNLPRPEWIGNEKLHETLDTFWRSFLWIIGGNGCSVACDCEAGQGLRAGSLYTAPALRAATAAAILQTLYAYTAMSISGKTSMKRPLWAQGTTASSGQPAPGAWKHVAHGVVPVACARVPAQSGWKLWRSGSPTNGLARPVYHQASLRPRDDRA